ncbi:hypothetical protein GUJ93_ZPchr0010g7798 [Zizania palustris]|uniref:Uncharacterized protein n=1 Tax=Zizania palustris TaxID=103762 RepID=A0A8J5WFZ1_ZIZPA|nr:hypothetical protein GUJ93_ZPchr0010g7798 [Zizania palustris]
MLLPFSLFVAAQPTQPPNPSFHSKKKQEKKGKENAASRPLLLPTPPLSTGASLPSPPSSRRPSPRLLLTLELIKHLSKYGESK